MAEKRVGIVVEAESDLKAFEGTIGGIEKLEDRVVKLQKQTVELRKAVEANRAAQIELNKAHDTGKITTKELAQQMDQLVRRENDLNASLKQVSFSQRTAAAEMRNLNFQQRDALQNAQLLASQFGVVLPQGLEAAGWLGYTPVSS